MNVKINKFSLIIKCNVMTYCSHQRGQGFEHRLLQKVGGILCEVCSSSSTIFFTDISPLGEVHGCLALRLNLKVNYSSENHLRTRGLHTSHLESMKIQHLGENAALSHLT